MQRRTFVAGATGMGMAMALGPQFWEAALAAPVQPSESPYGPLSTTPDENGLLLPEGFTSRVVASSLALVPGTTHLWHLFPDGGACLPTESGGWLYVSNSENPPPVDVPLDLSFVTDLALEAGLDLPLLGGVGVIEFDADGEVVDAYDALTDTRANCAGGLTPWGTWLSCEEWEDDASSGYTAGRVFEVDPFARTAVPRPSLGLFKHEAATCDPERQVVYLSEDLADGYLYRYVPKDGTWGSGDALDGGKLEAMAVDPETDQVTWITVLDFDEPPPGMALRRMVTATPFDGGEGIVHDSGRVYLTTKGDDRVWVYDIAANTMTVLYDRMEFSGDDVVLDGVDNIIVSPAHDLYVAEDGGNLQVCVITPGLGVFPVVQMTGPQHGPPDGSVLFSEVTGLALSPDGNRLYFNSERGNATVPAPVGPGPGILYEVTGPFRGGTLAAEQSAPPTTVAPAPTTTAPAPATPTPPATGTLPATGGGSVPGWAVAGGVAALVSRLLARRSAADDD